MSIRITRPLSWLPLAVTGAGAMAATVAAPRFLLGAGASVNQSYLVQAAVAVAGPLVLPMIGFKGQYGVTWFITSMAAIVGDFMGRYLAFGGGTMKAYPHMQGLGQRYYPTALSPGPGSRWPTRFQPSYPVARRYAG